MVLSCTALAAGAGKVPVDLARYSPRCGADVRHDADRLTVTWPMDADDHGRLVLDLRPGKPLIDSLGITSGKKPVTLLQGVEPVTFLTGRKRLRSRSPSPPAGARCASAPSPGTRGPS
jgi:hypothetical protein